MPNLMRPKGPGILSIPQSGAQLAVGLVLVAVVILLSNRIHVQWPDIPLPVESAISGLAFGWWCCGAVLTKLSRDAHVALLTGLSGVSLDGIISSISKHLSTTITGVKTTILGVAEVVGAIVMQIFHGLELEPNPLVVNAAVVAALVGFALHLAWRLQDNPPSVDQVIRHRANYTADELDRLRQRFG